MHVIIGDQKVNLTQGSNGRLQATFTASEDTQSIRIPSDCIGTLNVNDIQLEQGSQATPFVEPAVQSEDMSGIFKDLHELRIDIKDTEEGLSHQITINQEGLEQLISNTEERLDSRITITADTWQGELSDAKEGLENQITATASLWQTKLSDTEQELRSAIQLKADSLITLIEDTDSANFSKTEQLVNGLQSTVEGDLRSQRTQLENLITSSIESATGSRLTIWQTLNSHGSQISSAQGDISKVEQTVNGYSRRISDVEGKYSSIEQTVNGLNTEVNGYNGLKSRVRQMEGLIDARVTRSDVEGIIQNSGDSIWLAIGNRVQSVADNATMSGDEIISEINLSRSGVRIGGQNIFLDSNVTWTRDFRTRFASVMELRADQITSGTIDAAQIRVINLDVNSLTGNTTNFIRSNWNNISTQISIDDRGINIVGSGQWRRNHYNQNGIVLFGGSTVGGNTRAGTLGYLKEAAYNVSSEESGFYSTRDGTTRNGIGIGVNRYHDLVLGVQKNNEVNMYDPVVEIRGATGEFLIHTPIKAGKNGEELVLTSASHRGDYGVTLSHGAYPPSKLHLSLNTYLEARGRIVFYTRWGQRNFQMHDNNDSYRDISMQGNTIINQSDERLKTNILDYSHNDALGKLKNIDYVTFDWKDGKANQVGFIAQQVKSVAKELIMETEGYLTYDSMKYTHLIGQAVQQLSTQTEHQFSTHEKQIFELQQELSKANRRIKELEEQVK